MKLPNNKSQMKDPKTGLTQRQELYCQFRAAGKGPTESARMAGYGASAGTRANENNKNQLIINRIEQITMQTASATAERVGQQLPESTYLTGTILPEIRQIAITRDKIVGMLLRNIEEARSEKQYGTVRSSLVDVAKIAGVWVEKRPEGRFDFDGDLTTLSDIELTKLQALLKRLAAEDGETIDVTPETETETPQIIGRTKLPEEEEF